MHVDAAMGASRYRVDIRAGRHALIADEPAGAGGGDAGAGPFDFILSGLAACTAITLRMYAERRGWTLEALSTHLLLDVAQRPPRIERRVELTGDLDGAALERLRDIAERTPVTLALKSGFTIATQLGLAPS